jgi:aerobic-type carbon monoxide dehydrogenase small subunit (CoxS/CutS family)
MKHTVSFMLNGATIESTVEARTHLADFLRDTLGARGTHIGCEHGVCGACTVLVNGEAVRSCLMLAVQADGQQVTTIEGLAHDGRLNALQEAMRRRHGRQCGFCTPGVLATLTHFLARNPNPTRDETRIALTSNLCRCTGYKGMVDAVMDVTGNLTEAKNERAVRPSRAL